MTQTITQSGANAKSGAAKSCTRKAKDCTISLRVVNAIKDLWPRKTVPIVSHFTGTEERAVKYWLAGQTRLTIESVGALLDTDEGFAILAAIMGGSKRAWWSEVQLARDIRVGNAAIRKQEKRTAALAAQLSLLERQQ